MTAQPASSVTDTSVRRRTRRAVVEAAVRLWARDFAAPLSDVAEAAGVSRSTLHRYFADRAALIDACLASAGEAFDGLDQRSPTGSPLDELCRQIEQVVPLGHWVLFVWGDPARFADHPLGSHLFSEEATAPTLALVEQGQAAGDIDPDVPAPWLVNVYYSLLYGAAEFVVQGKLSAPEAARLAIRALRGGISTDPEDLRRRAR
jgi:AcrR family transcriptional regulator